MCIVYEEFFPLNSIYDCFNDNYEAFAWEGINPMDGY